MNVEYFNRIVDTYGLGADEFLDLFAKQDHKCAVCRGALVLFSTEPHEQPQVDHNHATLHVRGILCRTCNVAVGFIEKDPSRTQEVVDYLWADRSGGCAPKGRKPKGSDKWTPAEWREWRKVAAPEGAKARRLARKLSTL